MALAKCRECGTEVSEEAKVCPKCGISKPVKKTSLIAMIFAGIFCIFIFKSIIGTSDRSAAQTNSADASSADVVVASNIDPKDTAISSMKLDKWSWKKGGFDNVMLLNAKIKNEGMQDVKDIEIECAHSSNSGTRIDSNKKVIYELVKAGKTIKIKDFSMGFIHSQASSTSCRITDLVLL